MTRLGSTKKKEGQEITDEVEVFIMHARVQAAATGTGTLIIQMRTLLLETVEMVSLSLDFHLSLIVRLVEK